MRRQCGNHLGRTKGRKGTEKKSHGTGERVMEKLVEVRWMQQSARADENKRWRRNKRWRHLVEAGWRREEKPRWSTQLADQSAMAPPLICDELWAGDRCRGHFFNPNGGM